MKHHVNHMVLYGAINDQVIVKVVSIPGFKAPHCQSIPYLLQPSIHSPIHPSHFMLFPSHVLPSYPIHYSSPIQRCTWFSNNQSHGAPAPKKGMIKTSQKARRRAVMNGAERGMEQNQAKPEKPRGYKAVRIEKKKQGRPNFPTPACARCCDDDGDDDGIYVVYWDRH